MNAYTIEDTIIAYFDGHLKDDERSELLHRASVSPEIRQLFEDHAALREMAVRATQQVTIAPELEESLFQRIAELQEEEKLPVGFWNIRRLSLTAGAVALVLSAVANFVNFGNSNNAAVLQRASSIAEPVSMQFNTANIDFAIPNFFAGQLNSNHWKQNPASSESRNSVQSSQADAAVQNVSMGIMMNPSPRSAEVEDIPNVTESPRTLRSLEALEVSDGSSNIEFQLQAPFGSGFVAPAPQTPVSLPFISQWSASAAYNFDGRNLVGVKVTAGQFTGLSTSTSSGTGYTLVTGQMKAMAGSTEELFYRHRELVGGGLFYVVGGIGGGIYSLDKTGTVLSAELGLELPFSDRLLGGISLVIDNLRQGGSESQVLSSSSQPVIFGGSNQYNTLAGHIEYGLTYKF